MSAPITLGVDIATASTRGVALDTARGVLLARASAPLLRAPAGVSRQPADYARAALAVIAEVCRVLGPATRRVRALSITGTSGTVVPCAADGSAVGDTRLHDDTSSPEALDREGLVAASSLGRMLSLQHELGPPLLSSTVDVVAAALVGGPVAVDTSHALKAGIDLEPRSWPLEALRALGRRTTSLPRPVVPGTVLGVVSDESASAVGLSRGVEVVAGMTDGCTAQLSTGAVHDGDSTGVLGTTLVLKAVSDRELQLPDGSVYWHLAPDGAFWPRWRLQLSSWCPGCRVRWPGPRGAGPGRCQARAEHRSPLPVGARRRTVPPCRPSFLPMSSGQPVDDVDAYRAVLDGVASVERLGLETLTRLGLRANRHTITGGTRCAVWDTIRPTVLAPVVAGGVVPAEQAGSAVDAAILAADACARTGSASEGPERLTDTVDRIVAGPAPLSPDPTEADALEQSYQAFLAVVHAGTAPPMTTRADHSAEGRPPHHV